MVKSAIQETIMQFDSKELVKSYVKLYQKYPFPHINLAKPIGFDDIVGVKYGASTLYDVDENRYILTQDLFNEYLTDVINDQFLYSLCESVIEYVEQIHGLAVGRIRFNTLARKTCLRYHTDVESSLRFHIPVITTPNAFFVIDDNVERMRVPGNLYALDVTRKHTAVNAYTEDRVHLVFDGYERN